MQTRSISNKKNKCSPQNENSVSNWKFLSSKKLLVLKVVEEKMKGTEKEREMSGYSDRVLIFYCKINYYSRKNE
jgi:hypothetical protein